MPKLVGMNHIALEVDDIDEALAFWESIFGDAASCAAAAAAWRSSTWATSSSRSRSGRTQPPDQHRHFGLVVDDKEAVRARLKELGVPGLRARPRLP